MKEIKRYDFNETCNFDYSVDWVKYTDHRAVVEIAKDHSYDEGFNAKVDNYELKIETIQKRIEELEADRKEFCDLLVNRYDYSDRESDEITEKAEKILTKFDN